MKNLVGLKSASTLLIAFVLVLGSCKKDDEPLLSSTDNESLSSESVSDSYTDEANDMANISVLGVSDALYAGRTDGEKVENLKDLDERFKCATVTITRASASTKDKPVGTIIIDFGQGCTDAKGVVRKGKILVDYSGKKFFPSSVITTSFDGYYRNDVKIEGTHTSTNIQVNATDNPKFSVVIVGGKLTFGDGKTVTREQSFTREWQRGTTRDKDKWMIATGSSATGTNRNGKQYKMAVTADLVYSRACAISNKVFIAVSGTKAFTVETKAFTIDYGKGDCDNDITVTVNGASKTITVGADGK